MKNLIIGENIVKSFGERSERQTALNEVSIEINEGQFMAVMGPSGSGKSTLLFALSGMDGIDSGKVVFDGRDLSKMQENELADIRRRKMGFVFQQPTLLKNLNILDNIILPSVRDNKKDNAKITQKARSLMKKMDIDSLERRDITQVSGGQLQRAGICRALMSDPQIIFGDEPTGALNSKSAKEIMEIFSQINAEGTAITLVTHDAKVAARTECVLFMKDGKVVNKMKLPKFSNSGLDGRIKKITDKMQEIGI